ncbi:hypothetical protein [Marinobacter mobilis]|uniref:hypothetical protein n=1 Tax=Marinobacter mobilis TaxID=488533 RepID=UPI0035C6E40C
MLTSNRSVLLSVCLLSFSLGAVAEGLADRYNESGTQQAMDTIERIHSTYGATAAGPGGTKDAVMVDMDMKQAAPESNIDFPPGVETAHERKRYIFDSAEF